MTRRQIVPLRPLAEEERTALIQMSRAQREPASHVARGHCQLKLGRGAGAYFEAYCGGRMPVGQAIAGVPVTGRQEAQRAALVAR
jgi:hypothetical protein